MPKADPKIKLKTVPLNLIALNGILFPRSRNFPFYGSRFGLALTGQTRPLARHTERLFSLHAAVPRALNTATEPSSACAKSGGGWGGEVRGAADYHQPTSARSPCHDTHNLRAFGLCLHAGRVSNTLRHFRTNSDVEAWRRNDEAPFSFSHKRCAYAITANAKQGRWMRAHNYTYVYVYICIHMCVHI